MGRRCEVTLDTGVLFAAGAVADWPRVIVRGSLPDEMFDADGAHGARSDGGDVWASLDGTAATRVAMDLVFFSTDDDPALGTAELWVKLPDDTVDAVWVHWGGAQSSQPARGSAYGGNGVWSNSFGQVLRFWETPGSVMDRTGNGRDAALTVSGPTLAGSVAGMLSPCWSSSGAGLVEYTAWLTAEATRYTLGVQVQFSAPSGVLFSEGLDTHSGPTDGNYMFSYLLGPPSPYANHMQSGFAYGGNPSANSYSAGTVTYDSPLVYDARRTGDTGGAMEPFLNGVGGNVGASGGPLSGGTYPVGDTKMFWAVHAYYSLFTAATVARDDAWIAGWHAMLSDPEAGLTTGTPEAYDEPGFSVCLAGVANQVMGRRQC